MTANNSIVDDAVAELSDLNARDQQRWLAEAVGRWISSDEAEAIRQRLQLPATVPDAPA